MRGEMSGLGARRASGRPPGGGSHLPLCQAPAGAPAKRQVAQVGDVETKAGRQAGRLAGRQAGSSCWQAAEALRSSAAGSACARWSCESRGRDGAARACASARPSRAAISASSRQKGAVGVIVVLRRPAALRARLCGRPWLRAGGAAGRRSAPAALGRSIRPAPLAPAFGAVGLCCTPRRDVRANFLMRAPTAPSGGSGALRASAGRRWVALGAARFPAIRANLCLNAAAKRKTTYVRTPSMDRRALQNLRSPKNQHQHQCGGKSSRIMRDGTTRAGACHSSTTEQRKRLPHRGELCSLAPTLRGAARWALSASRPLLSPRRRAPRGGRRRSR
mmetsp:Transcript_873/g.2679  ORF Transcript_873/g.2679 Transcript_873/m.2679 type:complete len:333 (-) Transcript_873:912-1910(-)